MPFRPITYSILLVVLLAGFCFSPARADDKLFYIFCELSYYNESLAPLGGLCIERISPNRDSVAVKPMRYYMPPVERPPDADPDLYALRRNDKGSANGEILRAFLAERELAPDLEILDFNDASRRLKAWSEQNWIDQQLDNH